jgi:Neprosin
MMKPVSDCLRTILVLGMLGVAFIGKATAAAQAKAGAVPKQASAASGYECVARPEGAQPPPKLAPMLRSPGAKYNSRVGGSVLKARRLCPAGKVPVPVMKARPQRMDKGNPLLAPDVNREWSKLNEQERGEFIRKRFRTFEEVYRRPQGETAKPAPPPPGPPQCDGVPSFGSCYYYASASFPTAADGGGMTLSINKPQYVNTGGQGHTLNEIAVQGANTGNIIELGWLVSTEQYGNANPHLFVFHWKNGVPTCYDTCGWRQYSSTYFPGQDLGFAVGRKVYVGYVFFQGNWWAWFDNQWLGYFPGSEWNGDYARSGLIQWFGEVASQNGIPPKSDMGNGKFPGVATAASMDTLCDVDAHAWVCWYRDKQSLMRTVVTDYDINRVAFGSTRYGGPGQ